MASTRNRRDRKSTRLNSSHTVIYTLSLHDALPIYRDAGWCAGVSLARDPRQCGGIEGWSGQDVDRGDKLRSRRGNDVECLAPEGRGVWNHGGDREWRPLGIGEIGRAHV